MAKLIYTVILLILIGAFSASAQINPDNVPKPPSTELEKFAPFFGKYVVTSDYAGMKFSGTLEIKPVIKGWYIERTILVKNEDGTIDREFRSMITFDTRLKTYRLWRFETTQPRDNEMRGRFHGAEFIEEMEVKGRDGMREFFRNRTTMVNADELRIVTEIQDARGNVKPFGMTVAKRVNR